MKEDAGEIEGGRLGMIVWEEKGGMEKDWVVCEYETQCTSKIFSELEVILTDKNE